MMHKKKSINSQFIKRTIFQINHSGANTSVSKVDVIMSSMHSVIDNA